jgi:ketosteroid isomerase-like protein
MASTQSETQAQIKAMMDTRGEAIHAKDLDRLMSVFADDIVYFDIVPPLRYAGAGTLRDRFTHWFTGWESAIGQELRDLSVLADGDVAFAHMLIRASGTRTGGRAVDYWVRVSNGCRRANGQWTITHEHISIPVDFMTGKVAIDLAP